MMVAASAAAVKDPSNISSVAAVHGIWSEGHTCTVQHTSLHMIGQIVLSIPSNEKLPSRSELFKSTDDVNSILLFALWRTKMDIVVHLMCIVLESKYDCSPLTPYSTFYEVHEKIFFRLRLHIQQVGSHLQKANSALNIVHERKRERATSTKLNRFILRR